MAEEAEDIKVLCEHNEKETIIVIKRAFRLWYSKVFLRISQKFKLSHISPCSSCCLADGRTDKHTEVSMTWNWPFQEFKTSSYIKINSWSTCRNWSFCSENKPVITQCLSHSCLNLKTHQTHQTVRAQRAAKTPPVSDPTVLACKMRNTWISL